MKIIKYGTVAEACYKTFNPKSYIDAADKFSDTVERYYISKEMKMEMDGREGR